jgi:hypothetical protein
MYQPCFDFSFTFFKCIKMKGNLYLCRHVWCAKKQNTYRLTLIFFCEKHLKLSFFRFALNYLKCSRSEMPYKLISCIKNYKCCSKTKAKTNFVALVRERTLPTERSRGQRNGSLLLDLLMLLHGQLLFLEENKLLGRFHNFITLYTVGRTPSTSDQPVSRPPPKHRTTQAQK